MNRLSLRGKESNRQVYCIVSPIHLNAWTDAKLSTDDLRGIFLFCFAVLTGMENDSSNQSSESQRETESNEKEYELPSVKAVKQQEKERN